MKIPKIPEVQIPERIQQQTVLDRIEEHVGVIPAPPIVDDTVEIHVTERIQEQIRPRRIEDQVGDVLVPPIVEETVEVVQVIPREPFPESVDERIVDFPVPLKVKEIPMIVSSSHNAAHAAPTPVNGCAAPVRDVAHATSAHAQQCWSRTDPDDPESSGNPQVELHVDHHR